MTVPGVSGDLVTTERLAQVVDGRGRPMEPLERAWARLFVHWWRRAAGALGPASPLRAVFDVVTRPLMGHLGYAVERVERHPWGYAAILAGDGAPSAALVSAAWGAPPASIWRHAMRAGVAVRLPWTLVCNGRMLAVADGTRPWARRTLCFDLEETTRDERALMALARLARIDALGVEGASPLAGHVTASDLAGARVCAALGEGVIEALSELLAAFDTVADRRRNGHGRTERMLEQSLTLVYRLLFLYFAEARRLLPTGHHVYREAYGIHALCQRVLTRPDERGVWATVQAMTRLAHTGCEAPDLRVTAFNGRLFAPGFTPLGERRRVPDRSAAAALLALGTTPERPGRRPIAFHDLGVEQLGAVYERVLDYEPVRVNQRLRLRKTSTERKTTGSFYTPRTITDFLVRRTLGPLVDGRSSDALLGLRVVDPAMGSGAFLVAACRFLTERLESALAAEGCWSDGDSTDRSRAELARTVAERCLFGVDLNPTAVHLARLSLWLATLAVDRPLTFLDHHLAAGNSLVGARLADLAWPPGGPRAGREPPADQPGLFDDRALEALGRSMVAERLKIACQPSATVEDVRRKERRLAELSGADGAGGRWRRAADLWCGLALQPSKGTRGLYAELQRHLAGLETALPAHRLEQESRRAIELARAERAFHWELTFPEVFLDEGGMPRADAGFDAVLGNPPWEMLRADTGDAPRRSAARADLKARAGYVHRSGQYRLVTGGHVNQYQLFATRALQLLRSGGRFGLILPSGLQTDTGSTDLRRELLEACRLDTWLGFENRRGIFPVHRSLRFLLAAGTTGTGTESLPVRSGLTDPVVLDTLPDVVPGDPSPNAVRLTRAFLARWDPAHLTIPGIASALDAAVAWRALSSPPLDSRQGWGVRFGRELNATDDKECFVRWEPGAAERLPIVDGRHVRPFAVSLDRIARGIPRSEASRRLDAGASYLRARPCYRDVAGAANRLTLIAAMLPAGAVSTHTLFCARTALDEPDAWCLIALLNSLVANFLVRLQVTTHVGAALMARLRVPRPGFDSPARAEMSALATRLSRSMDLEHDIDGYARLNAVASHLYGLTSEEHAHVVSTFPLLSAEMRRRCLDAYRQLDDPPGRGPEPRPAQPPAVRTSPPRR